MPDPERVAGPAPDVDLGAPTGRSGMPVSSGRSRRCVSGLHGYAAPGDPWSSILLFVAEPNISDEPEHIGVALSGGGHRAAVFAVGALLAIVDRRLNRHVGQIASVSGGSIVNAYMATRVDFREIDSQQMTEIAHDLVSRIMKGVITPQWWVRLGGWILSTSLVVGTVVALTVEVTLGAVAGMATLMVGAILLPGRALRGAFHRRYLADSSAGKNPVFGDLQPGLVEHVLCTTDLISGQPVYFSTWSRGVCWRRNWVYDVQEHRRGFGESWDASTVDVTNACRASAAFPGLPPWRLSFRPLRAVSEPNQSTWKLPSQVARLADGGISNNLGSQVLREDGFYRGGTQTEPPSTLLCINASTPISESRSWPLAVPGLRTLVALRRSMQVLYENSIAPRLSSLRTATFVDYQVIGSDRLQRRELNLFCDLSEDATARGIRMGALMARAESDADGVGRIDADMTLGYRFAKQSERSQLWNRVAMVTNERRLVRTTLGPMRVDDVRWLLASGYEVGAQVSAVLSHYPGCIDYFEPTSLELLLSRLGCDLPGRGD